MEVQWADTDATLAYRVSNGKVFSLKHSNTSSGPTLHQQMANLVRSLSPASSSIPTQPARVE